MGSHTGVASVESGGGGGDTKSPPFSAPLRGREEVNLRLLLELRRRLKSAAEKELSLGRDRARSLRNRLHAAEADLRLCARAISTRRDQLTRTAEAMESARQQALATSQRLRALEEENEDFGQQLGSATLQATRLRESVHTDRVTQHGTLDAFLTATNALARDLRLATRDHGDIRARVTDMLEQSATLASRAEFLATCFRSADRALAMICDNVYHALDRVSGEVQEGPEDVGGPQTLEETVRAALAEK